ncbi:MAG TPA: hypothetical protein VFU21_03105 [Kofleriaceae bacterium]|nr:hypothetical protein [Kofleriaceae bacterium]
MTSGHLIFIPAVLVIGMFIGFLLGTRAAQDRVNMELKRQAEREEARKARAERKASRQTGAGGASSGEGEGDKAD